MDAIHEPVAEMTDDEDFVAFVTARWAPLYRFAWLLTGGHESAEDLLQLALEKSYLKWGRIRRMESSRGVRQAGRGEHGDFAVAAIVPAP